MADLGELFVKRSALLKEKNELETQMKKIAKGFSNMAWMLENPDQGQFEGESYPGWREVRGGVKTMRLPDDAVNEREIRSMHVRYAQVCYELPRIESDIKEAGGTF